MARLLRLVLVLGGAALFGACAAADGSGEGGARVVVSSSILGDVVANVAGDCATVDVLMPAGVDPHGFEPSAREAAALREADLVVVNGLGLEEQFESALETAEGDGVEVYRVAEALDPLPFVDPSAGGVDRGDGDEHEGDDPHVWHDPERMARATTLLADELAEHTDCDRAGLIERADAYAAELRAVDAAITGELATVPDERRLLVTNHDAFGYFAERYGFDIIGTVIPGGSTLAEPSAADLADLADLIAETGVSVVFVEASESGELADALVAETGTSVEVVELFSDSLGEEGSGAATYLELLQTNAGRIVTALTG